MEILGRVNNIFKFQYVTLYLEGDILKQSVSSVIINFQSKLPNARKDKIDTDFNGSLQHLKLCSGQVNSNAKAKNLFFDLFCFRSSFCLVRIGPQCAIMY